MPLYRYEIRSYLQIHQIVEALQPLVTGSTWLWEPKRVAVPFTGNVTTGGFRVSRSARLSTVFRGHFYPSENGTRIKITVTLHPYLLLLVTAGTLYNVYALVSAYSKQGVFDSTSVLFILFLWATVLIAFFRDLSKTRKILQGILSHWNARHNTAVESSESFKFPLPQLPRPVFVKTLQVAEPTLKDYLLVKKMAARLEEKARNVSVHGDRITFSGVSEHDAGKHSMLTSTSMGMVCVDKANGKISFALSLKKTIIKLTLLMSLLLMPIYLHHEPLVTYIPLIGLWLVFVIANIVTEVVRFNSYINRVIDESRSENK